MQRQLRILHLLVALVAVHRRVALCSDRSALDHKWVLGLGEVVHAVPVAAAPIEVPTSASDVSTSQA
jgi:hypothetical protein